MKGAVLVTGAAGFAATHCLLSLHRAGYALRTLRALARRDELLEVWRTLRASPCP